MHRVSSRPLAPFTGTMAHAGSAAPLECDVMISFNDGSAGGDARALCRLLNAEGVSTFCTGLYCPATGAGSNWAKDTARGIKTCKVLVMLMTEGWRVSPACNHEMEQAAQRMVDRKNTLHHLVPVVFPDFDKAKDKADKMWLQRVGSGVQQIYTVKKSPDEWMTEVLHGARLQSGSRSSTCWTLHPAAPGPARAEAAPL